MMKKIFLPSFVRKVILSILSLALIASGLFLAIKPAVAEQSQAPRFNYLAGDYELMQVRKAGTASWTDPVTASAGDVIEFLIYYHNGGKDAAHNVKIKAALPEGTSSKLTATASIKSEETAAISDTVVDGKVLGLSGGTVLVSGTESKLELVPNSGAWYTQDAQGKLIINQFPNGQNTASIFSDDGVNIGAVNGCWQYAGFIYFQAKLTGGTAGAKVEKWQALSGSANWQKEFQTEPANYVNYMIFYQNTGSSTAKNVQVVDTLPEHETFAPGTAFWRIKENNQDKDIPIPDSAIKFNGRTLTFSYGDVAPAPQAAFYLVFQILLDGRDKFPDGVTALLNSAAIKSDNGVNAQTDTVKLNVFRSPDPTINFSINKKAANLTIGQKDWSDHITASPADKVAFRINVLNQGNTNAQNVRIKDILPNYFNYQNGTTKLYINDGDPGTTLADGISADGVVISTIAATKMISLVFQTLIISDVPAGTVSLTNTAIVPVGANGTINWPEVKDTATVDLIATRGLSIVKTVKDKISGSWVEEARYEEGDVVTFKIEVRNNGNTLLNGVVARDALPTFLNYLPGSTYIDGIQNVSDDLVKTGLLLTDQGAGQGKTITFQARVMDCPPNLGDFKQVNTGFARANSVPEIADTASVLIKVQAPPLPGV